MEILASKDLSFAYSGCDSKAIDNVSFSCQRGDIVLLMGSSGCGKTTLLRLLKTEISHVGKRSGEVFSVCESSEIGFVMQNPDSQSVCDRVFGELCFGLENIGLPREAILRRVGETVGFFGIERLTDRELSTLSGGEKQLVNLCAVMMMNPKILILDEPLSRLDPVTAEEFISCILRLNRELGVTIIMSSHTSEGIFEHCTKLLLMEKGKLIFDGSPQEATASRPDLSHFFPAAARLSLSSSKLKNEKVPLNVRDAKIFLSENYKPADCNIKHNTPDVEEVLSGRDIWFRYDKNSDDVIKGADICLHKGEIFTVVGSNGAGKSTLLKVLAGLLVPYGGKIKLFGKKVKAGNHQKGVGFVPQDPYDIFVGQSVIKDYEFALKTMGEATEQAEEMLENLGLSHLKNTHPCDLSGGEAQLCAAGRVLLSKPEILLLDEPSKGLDKETADSFGRLLRCLSEKGVSILCVSHDLEFAAEFSHRCGLFFGGRIIGCGEPAEFFSHSRFYTTAAARIAENIFDGAVTVSAAAEVIHRLDKEAAKKIER